MVKVKICGITNVKDAQAAVKAGCDALGFVFFKKSPRYITPQQAGRIIRRLPKKTIKIGVFANASEKSIKDIAKKNKLDILQFHGQESAKFCDRFKDYKVIKVFRLRKQIDLVKILKYKTFAYLFDSYVPTKLGGTGKVLNWNFLTGLKGLRQPIFLSGGLNAMNVQQAIKAVHPSWVDASSSLEARPGKKDHKKLKAFIKAAKNKA